MKNIKIHLYTIMLLAGVSLVVWSKEILGVKNLCILLSFLSDILLIGFTILIPIGLYIIVYFLIKSHIDQYNDKG